MKKTIGTIILLLMLTLYGQAQNLFEGSVNWSLKIEYTDPVRADEAKQRFKEMNSPAGIQKMKDIEAKMKDSTFKKYVESNPAMKAQLELGMATMKRMQEHPNEDPLTVMMPKSVLLSVKKNQYYIHPEGGMEGLLGNVLCDSTGKKYSIKEKDKTYSRVPENKDTAALKSKVVLTKEIEKILDYTCKKYIIETEVGGKKVRQFVWTTQDVKPFNTKLVSDLNMMSSSTGIDFSKVEGVPLKMILNGAEFIITLTAVELKNEKIAPALFVIPKEYKEVPYVKIGK